MSILNWALYALWSASAHPASTIFWFRPQKSMYSKCIGIIFPCYRNNTYLSRVLIFRIALKSNNKSVQKTQGQFVRLRRVFLALQRRLADCNIRYSLRCLRHHERIENLLKFLTRISVHETSFSGHKTKPHPFRQNGNSGMRSGCSIRKSGFQLF